LIIYQLFLKRLDEKSIFAIMNKTDNKGKQTVFISFMVIIVLITLLLYSFKTLQKTPHKVEKVCVDSISIELRYPNLPDKIIHYHTKRGVFTSIRPIYSIGDSIEVQIIKIKK